MIGWCSGVCEDLSYERGIVYKAVILENLPIPFDQFMIEDRQDCGYVYVGY